MSFFPQYHRFSFHEMFVSLSLCCVPAMATSPNRMRTLGLLMNLYQKLLDIKGTSVLVILHEKRNHVHEQMYVLTYICKMYKLRVA